MELLQLRYFQVVANNQHITRSAEQLHVSQPAISTVISRLEQELGTPLFERSGRTIALNTYGLVFLGYVNRILLEVDNAQKEIRDLCMESDNTINLSVTSPQFLQGINEYMTGHPNTRWRQSVKQLPEIMSLLENGQIDISITSPGFSLANVESTVLLHDEFMIAMHPDHPLAGQQSITAEQIAKERFIALQKGLPFRTQTDQLFADMGIEPNIVMECDHYLRRELLNTNAGITMASRSAQFRHLYDPKIVFLKIENVKGGRDIVLSRLKGKYITKATQDFCAFLRAYYEKIALADNN